MIFAVFLYVAVITVNKLQFLSFIHIIAVTTSTRDNITKVGSDNVIYC